MRYDLSRTNNWIGISYCRFRKISRVVGRFLLRNLFLHQLWAVWRLRARYRSQTKIATNKYFRHEDIARNKTLMEITDELIINNIGVAFNRFLIYVVILFTASLVLCFIKARTTHIALDVKTSDITVFITNRNGVTKRPESFGISFGDSAIVSVPSDSILTFAANVHANGSDQVAIYPGSSGKPVVLSKMDLVDSTEFSLSVIDNDLHLRVSNLDTIKQKELTGELHFSKRRIGINGGQPGPPDTNSVISTFSFLKTLAVNDPFELSMIKPAKWKMKGRIFVTKIDFFTDPLNGQESSSALVSGVLRMLDITERNIELFNRDKLSLKFKRPTELFLSADSNLISVHIDGVANQITYGSEDTATENNGMPTIMSQLTGLSSYVIPLITALTPFLIALFIRTRKSV